MPVKSTIWAAAVGAGVGAAAPPAAAELWAMCSVTVAGLIAPDLQETRSASTRAIASLEILARSHQKMLVGSGRPRKDPSTKHSLIAARTGVGAVLSSSMKATTCGAGLPRSVAALMRSAARATCSTKPRHTLGVTFSDTVMRIGGEGARKQQGGHRYDRRLAHSST